MEHVKRLDDMEIRLRGIEALNKALGPAAALKFLSLYTREHTDYVKISERIYKDQTVEDIFQRAKNGWRE